ncbi:MAG: hypothetical protein ACI8XO_004245, partial [Verrucomicrobiales bacterium]
MADHLVQRTIIHQVILQSRGQVFNQPVPRVSAILLAILFLSANAEAQLVDTVFAKYKPQVDLAVDRGLAYLASAQKEDGTFGGTYGESTGVVSLVGMAFLSKGNLPGEGPYGDTVNRCIDYVLASQKPNGLLVQDDAGHGP